MESDDDQKVYTIFFYYNYFLCISNMDLVLENYFIYVMEWQLEIENFDGSV